MPVFQAVLTDMAAFGGAEGAFQVKKERCGGSCIIRAAQMAGIIDAFFICRPREWLRQNHFDLESRPKRKKAGGGSLRPFWVGRLASAASSGGAYN